MPSVSHCVVTPEEAGQKLFQYLSRRLGKDVPKSLLMRLVRTGQVRVDGRRAKPFDRLRVGQTVRIPPVRLDEPEKPNDETQACDERLFLPILYQSNGVLAINKPAGLPVQPGTGWTDCVAARLAVMFPEAPFQPTPAHRLDRDTSGVLLAGTSYEGLRRLQEMFRFGGIGKDYLAVAKGRVDAPAHLVDALGKAGPVGRERVVVGAGKRAEAELMPLRPGKNFSLVLVRLLTGRTHQIRVQLASRGHPLLGDMKYGGGGGPLHLHAWRITLPEVTVSVLPDWEGDMAVSEDDLTPF
ncbi:RluA family pseudouridine synthase [Desulfovibrio inopinatus]|uniref:RluA family pseudouridine synthase n=1 Tax=Desulfovibrio inopinatus TaxID=102109 RepID=UPI0004133DD0|nr:RluA family pseudouridine synthase [Desulfovibrio inopinatus]